NIQHLAFTAKGLVFTFFLLTILLLLTIGCSKKEAITADSPPTEDPVDTTSNDNSPVINDRQKIVNYFIKISTRESDANYTAISFHELNGNKLWEFQSENGTIITGWPLVKDSV